jgi:acyl-CoA dehydrogenase
LNFDLSPAQLEIRGEVRRLARSFSPEYWRDKDDQAEFPNEFFNAMAKDGWLGVAMPEAYGGAGLGITEAAIVLQEIAASGAALSGTSAIHMNIFGVNPIVKHGTTAQKMNDLPKIVAGQLKVAFGVTEPNAGLETTRITTRAERSNGGWEITGHKIWISTAQEADKVLLVTRTSPYEEVEKKTEGITLFFVPLDPDYVRIREIHKCGRAAVDSNEVWFDHLPANDADVVGEIGRGFYHLLDGLNPERILVAAEAIGIGRAALDLAVKYANEREVFGHPIGQNQGIQFPLARCHADLEAANLMVFKAAWLYDNGQPCGAEANIAKLLGAEYGFAAADQAMQTLGGMGYAREYDIERLWREVKLCRLAPVSPELILAYVGEKVLGLPKSY